MRACAQGPVRPVWLQGSSVTTAVRPAALSRFHAALDGQGQVLGYVCKSASGSVSHQFFQRNLGFQFLRHPFELRHHHLQLLQLPAFFIHLKFFQAH